MATTNDPIQQIFLAGVGALAIGAENAKKVAEKLVEQGSITVEQGKDLAQKAANQAEGDFTQVRDEIIKSHLKVMTKEQRDEFAARVAELAANMDADDELENEEAEEVEAAAKKQ